MNEQTNELIKQLADKLGTTTEYLWAALIRQAPIDAYSKLIVLTTLTVLSIIFIRRGLKQKEWFTNDEAPTVATVLAMIGLVAIFICTLNWCMNLQDILAGIFNPEYWALKEILREI